MSNSLKTLMAVLGSLPGLGAAAAIYFFLGVSWIGLGVVAGVVLVGYILAAIGAAPTTRTTSFGEVMRGFLIGFNSALNGFIGFAVLTSLGGMGAGIAVGAALGVLNYLCLFGPITQSEVFQGFVGWLSWLFPMSWLVFGLGVLFFVLSGLLHLVTAGKVGFLRIEDVGIDAKTGTTFVHGGMISNLNYAHTAFDMGNFAYVYRGRGTKDYSHEAGHNLNLMAFGSVFHLIGAVDENILPARGHAAFAERIAESNASGTGGMTIPMWA